MVSTKQRNDGVAHKRLERTIAEGAVCISRVVASTKYRLCNARQFKMLRTAVKSPSFSGWPWNWVRIFNVVSVPCCGYVL